MLSLLVICACASGCLCAPREKRDGATAGERAVSVFDDLADALAAGAGVVASDVNLNLFPSAPQPWDRFVPVYLPLPNPHSGGERAHRLPDVQPYAGPTVVPVLLGEFQPRRDQYKFGGSAILVRDQGGPNGTECVLIVDTGIALFKNTVLGGLSAHGLRPDDIKTVILTHEGVDSMGNLNLFRDAQVISGRWRTQRDQFYDLPKPAEVYSLQQTDDAEPNSLLATRPLCANTDLYLTPGFGQTDVSVLVGNVKDFGAVAIVGNLILFENDDEIWPRFAPDDVQRDMWAASRKAVICLADYIIPGHGQTFRVTDKMKRDSMCVVPE